MKKIIFGMILSLFFVPGRFAFAQEADAVIDPDAPAWSVSQPLDNGTDCFEYYKFQSVIASVGPDQQVYQPGTDMRFAGTVKNDNDYPVVDGNLFVRIGRANDNYMQEGQNVVDEFIAVKDIAIDAKSEKKVDFIWKVPIYGDSGSYVVDYFFSVGKKFNLGGLPFSNEVTAGTAHFDISSTITNAVAFDKSATTFNGEKYNQIGSWPKITAGAEATINNVLRNPFSGIKDVNVTQELYRWDSLNEADRLDKKTFTVAVPANGTADISYRVPDTSGSAYYLKTIASDADAKSIINVRFSTDAPRARLNYPAITKFPIKKGDAFTLFSCFHNSTDVDTNGRVQVVLSDRNGNEIGKLEYDGNIPSAMSAAKADISAGQDYDYVRLKAEIKDKDGNAVDRYEATYDCAQIDKCNTAGVNGPVSTNNFVKTFAYVLLFIVTIIAIIILARIIKRNQGPRMGIFIFGLLVAGGLSLSHGALAVGDQSASSSSNYSLYQVRDPFFGNVLISTGNVSLNHYMNVSATNVLCGGSATFNYGSNLFYNASGGSWDTPYGGTSNNFGNIANVGQYISGNGARGGYIYFTYLDPGSPILKSSNTAIMTCSGMTCSAVPGASGTARITANLGATTARIWALIAYYKPRCDEHRSSLSCGGSVLGHPRCSASNSTYWVSPTEDNFSCGGGNTQGSAPSFKTIYLGGSSLSWDITVGACAVPIVGKCGASANDNYAYTATGPSTPLCSAGTPSPVAVSFPSGAYGESSRVTWMCNGSGGGTNATCSAARLSPSSAPTLDFTATPTTIVSGTPVTLNWTTSSDVTYCWAESPPGWQGQKTDIPAGSQGVSPTTTTTYDLECWNAANISTGKKTVTVTVTVAPPPLCSPDCSDAANHCTAYDGGCGSSSCSGTKVGTCSDGSAVCSGVEYNDSCGDKKCTGTKIEDHCASNTCIGSKCTYCDASGTHEEDGTKDCRDNNWKEVSPN